MKVASLRPDYLPIMSAAKTSKHSLLVKHHILAIDEASLQKQMLEENDKETLLATYQASGRSILNYCYPVWTPSLMDIN